MKKNSRAVLGAALAAAISAVLASCGSPDDGGPAAQFGTPLVTPFGTPPIAGSLAFGDGNFGSPAPIEVQAPADVPASGARQSHTPVVAGDLDGDGHADIVDRWTDTSALSILYGNGDGTFRATNEYALDVPGSIERLADLNGDGRPDLVLAGAGGIVTLLNTR